MTRLLHAVNHGPLAEGLRQLPSGMDSLRARAQLLKIGLQESRLTYRDQLERGGRNTVLGPALGLWQFERGAVTGLLTHRATRRHLLALCDHYGVQPITGEVWRALKGNDAFAAAVARLNLWWAPNALPDIHDAEESWKYYLNCWRPGAVKRDYDGLRAKWERNHKTVVDYLLDAA